MDLTASVRRVVQRRVDLGSYLVARPQDGLVMVRPDCPTACRAIGRMLDQLRRQGFQAWIAEEPEQIAVLRRPGERWITPEEQLQVMAAVIAELRARGAPAGAVAACEQHRAEALA